MNSFKFLERAIQYEVRRQIELIEDGGTVIQETRLYDSDRDETRSMRSKEDAHDYRYFPDPDLPPLVVEQTWIDEIKASMPELPTALRERFTVNYGLPAIEAAQLCSSRDLAEYFENVVHTLPAGHAKIAANWMMGEVSAQLNREEKDISDCPVPAKVLGSLLTRIIDGKISNKIARDVFAALWLGEFGGNIDAIIEAKGLTQINDAGAIAAIIEEVMADHANIVAEYRAGKEKAFNSLVGQVMKAAKGKANPQQVNDLLKSKLGQ